MSRDQQPADDLAERAAVAELAALIDRYGAPDAAERLLTDHVAGPDGHCAGCAGFGWVRRWPCRHQAVGERVAELRGGAGAGQ